jgi:hypothetical protein
MPQHGSGYLERPAPSGLADVIEIVLDKGIVIDAYVRVSLLGIEVVTIDARVVVASVDTYLRFAEATNRLDLEAQGGESPIDLLTEGAEALTEKIATSVVEHKVEGVVEPVKRTVGGAVDKVEDVVEDIGDAAGDLIEKVRSHDE